MSNTTAVTDDIEESEVDLDQEEVDSDESTETDSDDVETNDSSDDEPATEEESSEDESEVTVSIGEESPPQESQEDVRAPEWVRELRKTNRDLKRQNREFQEKLKTISATENKPVELGRKPTLEDSDYDAEKFEQELAAWFENKRKVEEQEAQKRQKEKEEADLWSSQVKAYEEKKSKLKVQDYEDAEEVVTETLSQAQLGMIVQGADDPAIVVYALGKNSTRLKELASIKDHVKFAFAVSKLETQLKVTTKKRPPAPEKTINGSGGSSTAGSNAALERLRAEAEKTGDYTKVIEYKRKLKAKG